MEEGLRSCLFFSQRKWSLGMETYYMSNQLSPPLIPNTAAREVGKRDDFAGVLRRKESIF